jgi:hypothetical protein
MTENQLKKEGDTLKLRRTLITTIAVLLMFLPLTETSAQDDSKTPRFELGMHFAMMTRFDATRHYAAELTLEPEEFSRRLNLGIGARATFNMNRYISLETEWNALPQDNEYSGKKSQWFYGLKVGVRKQRYGIFAKARPGYMYFSKDYCDDFPPVGRSNYCLGSLKRNPALDIGGVLELYTKRLGVVRIDIGDTAVRFNNVNRYRQELGPPLNFADQVYGGRTHSLQVNVGVGIRF